MKKIESENWISAARSVAPSMSAQMSARSATLVPRPRFAGVSRPMHTESFAG